MATNMKDYAQVPNSGLRAYLSRVEKGNAEEYRTTFFKGKSLFAVLDGWRPKLNTLKHTWPTLVEFENDLRGKVGPMSIMKPLRERMDDIESYYESILLDSQPIDDRAVAATIDKFEAIRGFRIRGQNHTVDLMKKSTNSGLPYFKKRRDVVSQTIPVFIEDDTQTLHGDDRWKMAAVLGWRGQEGGPEVEDVKQRVVWMFPFGVNIEELRLYQPLIEGCQKHNLVPAWVGMEAVDQRITALFDTKGKHDDIICTDFSKFDQHFNSDMQSCARDILNGLCSGDDTFKYWIEEVFPVKYRIPLLYQWGELKFGDHGMGSGSGGTNADETLAHTALQFESAIKNGKILNPNSMCLGDDGLLTYPGIDVESVCKTYSSHGQEMNLDKQYVSKTDCIYLRRWHHTDYRIEGVCAGVYSTYRALGRLCEQERYYDPKIWGPKMVALRQLSIIENVKYHPLRNEFADYCMKGDKYRLGLDIPSFLDDIEAIAKSATELMPDFLGYTKSLQLEGAKSSQTGIKDWWIVNYLKSQR